MKCIKIKLFAMVLVVLPACEDRLFQDPITSKTSGKFYSTENEIEEAVNGVYGTLQLSGIYGRYIPTVGEIPSDNTFTETPLNDGGVYGQMNDFKVIPQNEAIAQVYQHHYQGIQAANVVLNRIGNVSFANEATKSARTGEAKFLRSLLYFNMVRVFGDVPLVTEETVNPQDFFGQARTAKAEVYEQIIKDLTEAIPVLPDGSEVTKRRVTKQAAQALLGEVYLTQQDYANAKTQLEAVTNSSFYGLLPEADSSKIFVTTQREQKSLSLRNE